MNRPSNSTDSTRSQPLWRHFCASLLVLAGLVTSVLATLGLLISFEIPSEGIRAQVGNAYTFDLAGQAPFPLVLLSDTEAAQSASNLILVENGNPLGPPHSVHTDIKNQGGGRYSVWQGVLIFSTSDNTDPRHSGHNYAAEATALLPPFWLIGGLVAILVAMWLERGILERIWLYFSSAPPVSWIVREVFPPLIGTFLVLVLIFVVGELYFRNTAPFLSKTWPVVWDPRVGFRFAPGAEVRHTNQVDFWTTERSNSLGFLDREPLLLPDLNSCRVAFVGDSFVEAAQVNIADKAQVRLEKLAAASHPNWNLKASAFGFSGTGQLNQLPFYDQFVRTQQPHLVVLVVVSNDFANNSVLLESVRNGWHPDHSPRQFAARSKSGQISLLPMAADWERYRLPPPPSTVCSACTAHVWLKSHSYFYAWVSSNLRFLVPMALAPLEPGTGKSLLDHHRRWLMENVPYAAEQLADWDSQIDMDSMFYEHNLPPVFENAIELTGYAFDEFNKRTQRDGSTLVLLAASEMSLREKSDEPQWGRRFYNRLSGLAYSRSIPLLDQYAWVRAQGRDPRGLGFRLDAHWNEEGHDVAARMVMEYLEQNPEICSGKAFGS